MKTVLLRLEGAQMAWGTDSRFDRRGAGTEPSKSAVIGIIGAALGMERDDKPMIARLAACKFGVRVDREGRSLWDLQTIGGGSEAKRVPGADGAILTQREYTYDASHLVACGFEDHDLAARVDAAIDDPVDLVGLGRLCCVPSRPIRIGIVDLDPETALRRAPWTSGERPEQPIRLVLDPEPDAPYGEGESRQDIPISFDPLGRSYRRRWVRTLLIDPGDLLLPGEQQAPPDVSATPWVKSAARSSARGVSLLDAVPLLAPHREQVAAITPRIPARTEHKGVYLTRLFLNAANSVVQRDLKDIHAMHRTLMGAFPIEAISEGVRAKHGVLYRVDRDDREGRLIVWVQSTTEPDWSKLPPGYLTDLLGITENPAMTVVSCRFKAGEEYNFVLRANPLPRAAPPAARGSRNRVTAWLEEEARAAGFALPDLITTQEGRLEGFRPDPRGTYSHLSLTSVLISGRLRVRDPEALARALREGFGRAKHVGFGLMTLTPVPESGKKAKTLENNLRQRPGRLEGHVDRLEGHVDRLGGHVDRLGGHVDRLPETYVARPDVHVLHCTVCKHRNCSNIDALLRAGAGIRATAARFGMAHTTMVRHAKYLGITSTKACGVCQRPDRAAIDEALARGAVKTTAEAFGVSLSTLKRHAKHRGVMSA